MSAIDESRLMAAAALGLVLLCLILGFFFWLRRERDDEKRAERWNLSPVSSGGAPRIPIPSVPPFERTIRDANIVLTS